jgi:hypothetical protein
MSGSRPGYFIPLDTALGIYSVWGQVGPEESLNASEEKIISGSCQGSNQ